MDMLDTDILIDVQRNYPPAIEWFNGLAELPIVPGFVAMELIQDARDRREVQRALRSIAPLAIAWPSASDCKQAFENFVSLHLSHNLGLIDSLIAACAVGRSARLITFNVKHYRMVPDLVTVQP